MNATERSRRASIRVVVVTDLSMADWSLRRLLEEQPGVDWVGSTAELEAAKTLVREKQPDVVLVDLDGQHDAATIRSLAAVSTDTEVLALATLKDDDLVKRCVLAGASGVVFRSDSPELLIKAVERVSEGEMWVDRQTTREMVTALAREAAARAHDPEQMRIARLSRRERCVVEAVAAQPTAINKSIAEQLHISVNTLRSHLSAIFRKLEVSNRWELLAYAHRHGLVPLYDPESR